MNNEQDVVAQMRHQLMNELIEWFGFEIPDADALDFDYWTTRKAEIVAIRSLDDVRTFLQDDRESISRLFERFGALDHRALP